MSSPDRLSIAADPDPRQVVRDFLEAMQAGDLDGASELLTEDAQWINVSLPTVRGRKGIDRVLRLLMQRGPGTFRVVIRNIAGDGDVVLTERLDELGFGPLQQRFWVYGRFELRGGKIAGDRSDVDWMDILVSLVRGVLGIASPRLNRPWPAD
jgi:limonene-1,2-epoxide hydrolase